MINFISADEEAEEFIIDLRINNGAEQAFDEWFTLANEYIGSTDSACNDRRHGSEERMTQWISVRHFTNEVCLF